MPDGAIVLPDTDTAPKDYTLAGTQEIQLKSVRAVIDGTGAGSAFLPTLQLLDPNGHVMWEGPSTGTVAAGGSADVSWFPRVNTSSSGDGIRYDVDNVGDWLNVATNGPEDLGMTFSVDDAGGYTVTDFGGGGISFQEKSTGGFAVLDQGNGGISLNETGTGPVDIESGLNSNGIKINDLGANGVTIQANGTGDLILQSTATGRVFIIGTTAGVFMVGLPTVAPGGSKQVWNNGGVLNITP